MSAEKVLNEIQDPRWKYAWSWNRDEYAVPTKTYRHFLCPLWAGASGHTGGALMFWAATIGKELVGPQKAAVTAGLFTVWRLYYDKRISANHTLAETFEGTGEPLADSKLQLTIDKADLPRVGSTDDAFLLIKECWARRKFADPILLMHAIGASYVRGDTFADQFTNLKTDIDYERVQLSVQFTVPVWSWSLDTTQGLATTSFLNRPLASTLSPLSTVVLVPQPSDNVNQALATLTKKDGDQTKKDGNQ